ncbi:MAG: flavin-dependent dehydrogenase [Limnospira sp. PMC 1291.21]|uniref:NAD(P)/FAD-dependent oxidoreductase n=1 Tax=unclassified Limnospira TaxID=2642885 RepID=UPI0028E0BE04|nr:MULTISPECIES: flavin-dependent dehydrogenase [unclassified Limnospira]MDT9176160.1 flavin-dependent dehydrogenase [Limnospira sp. PMC 1238.20]MDT9201610.1 flavin-dependent dehydrogenase [Limnospira sp. PMC 1243.20]MDT9222138.1 flavin-dependent dehydrogenase [Limnospira sp. PMC 1279.21]MDT9227152.1 flavin-dependent dehydrogenase [Limnospira sp. PMC 1242.20]MDT9237344.1 flavin-dependent dehydrogenase [Limnospira sp. PMC 1261.20]
MKEILYLEIPNPDTHSVCTWLQQTFNPGVGEKMITPDGFRLKFPQQGSGELSVFTWSVQRTTYLKVFRVGTVGSSQEKQVLNSLETGLRQEFPYQYPEPPAIDLSKESIFEALAAYYPQTVKYFQKIPNGEYDLKRVYWWEKRWREGVRNPQTPKQVIFTEARTDSDGELPSYDLIYVGGALGVIHAAVMARLGYRVLLMERLPFGRMNREWNISRSELQSLIDLGLFTGAEVESFIAREYKDGFHKFFDANNPPIAKGEVLHTPRVLNVAINTDKLLSLCGEKLRQAGGEIWDKTEFIRADIGGDRVKVTATDLTTNSERIATGRLLVDAMGTASPIAWQLNGDRTFDSVCPTVGAVINGGFEPGVWDSNYGDVLHSHGDISKGRQLIWELFPGEGDELTIYLFHYHQVNQINPGSLLEMYEDFFTILPEYRRCNLDNLVWKKATFGYIPGYFSLGGSDRTVAYDRLIAIGDAACLQSPLVFTGFGSLVRNLSRLTDLLNTALKHDLLTKYYLNKIRAYQSNIAVTWLFSKGMMVPTGRYLPPQRINSILNTFFGLLATEPEEVANTFIKDRTDWWTFNRLALKAARMNPQLLIWILDFVNTGEVIRWMISYFTFTWLAFISWLFSWVPPLARRLQPWLEPRYPGLWLLLLSTSYVLTDGLGQHQPPLLRKLQPRTS